MPLRLEVQLAGEWKTAGYVFPGEPPGSISDNGGAQRDLIMFDCHRDHSEIWRSVGGADYERGSQRVVVSVGREDLARLRPGTPPYVLTVTLDSGTTLACRWTHQSDAELRADLS